MKIIDTQKNEIEIKTQHWPLAESLFQKWGNIPNNKNEIKVKDIKDIYPELSAWGIPWQFI